MRFMMIVKANDKSERGELPDAQLMSAMMKYNEELHRAGVLLDVAGLQPSSRGVKVRFSGDQRTVIDGPFSEAKELIAGYWVIEVKSKAEAIEWIKRCPNPHHGDGEIELRPLFETADFAEGGPELAAIASKLDQLKPRP